MPDRQLHWDEVLKVLVKRRKAGQAPHWSMGWVAARVARTESETVNTAFRHTVLDYYSAHATQNEDAVKTRTWHRLIGFVDGLHNAGLADPASDSPAVSEQAPADLDHTIVMDP